MINKARKSVAGFKIRDGMAVCSSVTLRKVQMYTFLTKLIHIVLPRITNIGFGILSVKGNIRRPWPAANIIAVLGISTSEEGSCSMNIKSYRSSLSHFQ